MVMRLMAVAAALAAAVSVGFAEGERGESIRVGLHYGSQVPGSVVVSGRGEWKARRFGEPFEGEARIAAGRGELVLEIGHRRGGVGPWIELWPREGERPLKVDGRAYRGRLRIEVQRSGGLKVVNTVEIEDYVRGVVPNEMFADGEAFKVQAVISRTLGLYAREVEKKHARDGFDICATGHCQVYRGANSETRASDRAVAATRGEVLTYRGRPIFSAYHANAGGETQPVDEAWPGSVARDFPYLGGVKSPYDVAAKDLRGYEWCYRWRLRVAGRKIRERVRARWRDVGEVRELVVKGETKTGIVRDMEVVGSRGRVRLRRPTEVKGAVGTPSAHFEVRRVAGGFELTGWGRGHGVGLSQQGALGMAKAEYSYPEILGHYYRGVSLAEEYGRGESRALTPPELKMEVQEVAPVVVPEGVG